MITGRNNRAPRPPRRRLRRGLGFLPGPECEPGTLGPCSGPPAKRLVSSRICMRILIVSDIHANWAALSAIDEPHDVCICLGDLVDYGPDPSPCVRWAMENVQYAVRGNHDHGVAQGVPVVGEDGYRYLTRVTRPLMWDALAQDERSYLLQLPVMQRLTLDGKRYLLVHAT